MYKDVRVLLRGMNERIRVIEAVNVENLTDGVAVSYKSDGMERRVYYPESYEVLNIGKVSYVGACLDNASACRIVGLPVDKDCPSDDLHELINQHIAYRALKKMYRKKTMNWIILGIGIVALVVVLIGGVMYFMNKDGGA